MFEPFKDFLISLNIVVWLSFFYVLWYFKIVNLPKILRQNICQTGTGIDKSLKTRLLQILTANKTRRRTCKSAN